ncbi:hypothetical protein AB0X79_07770 [Pediococcus pentosaceus]|uniref:hypothetical protein n=1 Tax=Pediococcus pentosaceus TaxID=1255 RepID=UPI003F248DED
MTKDELNEVLKKQNLKLSRFNRGLLDTSIAIIHENGTNVLTITDEDNEFFERNMSKETLTAIAEYANTPVEERTPEPQLYNVVIGRDLENDIYTAWMKNGDLEISNYVRESMLYGEPRFKFTKEDIEKYKSRLSPIEQSIVDLGTFPVGTDYEKEFAHD